MENTYNIIHVDFKGERIAQKYNLWQYDYNQILQISGLSLPATVEIHFSLTGNTGETETRVATTKNGITQVQIPNELLRNDGKSGNYSIFAFIYVVDEDSGNTEYEIILHVKSRPAPGEIGEDPEEKRILDEAVEMVNQAADRAEAAERGASDQAAAAEQSKTDAAESAETAKKYLAETEEVKEETVKELTELSESVKTVIADGEESIAEKQTIAEKSITDHTDTEIARLDRETQASEERLTETIRTANNTAEAVENTASEARRAKESLDASVRDATETRETVAASVRTANAAKKNLEQSTADANVAKTALDKTIQSADDQNASLGEKIETSKQLKTDLQTAGEKAVQDIQTAGSEQLGKMQAVAEEFTADREQIVTNKEDIGSLKEDLSNKITKLYASNQGETHITDSDNGKIQDMVLYGKSEQNQYKGINLLPTDISYLEITEVLIPKKTRIFWATDGTPARGGNFKFYNEDKTQETWFGVDKGKTAMTITMNIDAKYMQFLIPKDQSVKICLGIGDDPVYEPYTGGQPSPSPDYPQEIKSVVNPTVKVSSEDETESQTVQIPYTFNAIPVSSGGNVTIGKQQYISDYLDIEKGKLYRKVKRLNLKDVDVISIGHGFHSNGNGYLALSIENVGKEKLAISNRYKSSTWTTKSGYVYVPNVNSIILVDDRFTDKQTAIKLVQDTYVIYTLSTPTEEDLSLEQIKSLKSLSTNYPVTNITVGSEELDGYTVFNYPISMENGWNYVKQQLGDTRDYIYDMDAKAQDIDIQSAEAYVNSEYAVTLTELEA